MHRATLIRSVTHGYNSHNPYGVLTGFTGGDDRENYYTKRTDHPGIGSVCQYLGMGPADLPCQVYLPAHPGYSQGLRRAGPYGGYLGRQYDPLFGVCDPKFDREFDQNKEFYNPIAPLGAPRLPSIDDVPGVTRRAAPGAADACSSRSSTRCPCSSGAAMPARWTTSSARRSTC